MVPKIKKTLGFIISSLVCAILIYVLLTALFPPRILLSPYYILAVYSITGLFLFVSDLFLPRLVKWMNRINYFQSIHSWSKRKKIVSASVMMIIFILLIIIKPILDNVNDNKLKEEAKQQFLPIPLSAISEGKIDRTLIELQKTLDKLRSEYVEKPPHYLINVYLFSDLNELINKTGMSDWAAGGVATLPDRPPVIAIPVEKESSIWNNTLPTSTPSHEATHVVTFEVMQLKDLKLIDGFYLEGMAVYESLKDFNRFPDRIFNRVRLIFYNNQLTRLRSISAVDIKDKSVSREDVELFYRLSGEFVRYLVHYYGERKPWRVVQDVGQGMNFYEAFRIEYGKEYSEAFSEFLGYFY